MPLEPGVCFHSLRPPQQLPSCLWWARQEHRSGFPTHAPSLLPQERLGSQDHLFSGCNSQQSRGDFPPRHKVCLQFQAPSDPLPSPPEVGLLRGHVLMLARRPRAPFQVSVSEVPCTLPRAPDHSTSVHKDKETEGRLAAAWDALIVRPARRWRRVAVQDFVTLWTIACQAPLSMRFSRQECWSGVPVPSPAVSELGAGGP